MKRRPRISNQLALVAGLIALVTTGLSVDGAQRKQDLSAERPSLNRADERPPLSTPRPLRQVLPPFIVPSPGDARP